MQQRAGIGTLAFGALALRGADVHEADDALLRAEAEQ